MAAQESIRRILASLTLRTFLSEADLVKEWCPSGERDDSMDLSSKGNSTLSEEPMTYPSGKVHIKCERDILHLTRAILSEANALRKKHPIHMPRSRFDAWDAEDFYLHEM
mmetsp:Transcript_47514/g.143788  ORF Transcript_47514/g.143788 Transcript_47514/m.143788 type:complete len:110 (-) Transcript_47514:182-511(-)